LGFGTAAMIADAIDNVVFRDGHSADPMYRECLLAICNTSQAKLQLNAYFVKEL
jgi:hypothetical protein